MILEEFYEDAGLFCAPDGTVYAHARAQDHRETWPILSRGFRRWLNNWIYQRFERVPKSEDLKEIIGVLEARACASGVVRPVFMRIAEHDGNVYVDLADHAWRAAEITPDGWRVIDAPPVRFRRAAGMRPLPAPEQGGSIDGLRRFVNLGGDQDFRLAVAWVLAALSGRGPYPVLALAGEQGSAKSTAAAVLRALIDPNTAPIRSLPREERDLFIAATNSHVLAFDNVSGLPGWLSDALCRLSTGGGWACRQLYTDNDEVLFDGTRPAVLNGIEDFISRPDLADRALFLTLAAIPEERRMPERTFWLAFERERPCLLGALFDMVAHGLRELPNIHLASLPRLADFALWITACEGAAWERGAFLEAFEANRRGLVDTVLEADPVASAVRALMATRDRWVGTASGLLGALAEHVDDATRRGKAWPATPRALSARLRRAATFLRKVGVTIEFVRQGHESALVRIEGKSAGGGRDAGDFASAPSASSENGHKGMKLKGFPADANADGKPRRTKCGRKAERGRKRGRKIDGGRKRGRYQEFCVRAQPLKTNGTPTHGRCGRKISPFLAVRTRLRLAR